MRGADLSENFHIVNTAFLCLWSAPAALADCLRFFPATDLDIVRAAGAEGAVTPKSAALLVPLLAGEHAAGLSC